MADKRNKGSLISDHQDRPKRSEEQQRRSIRSFIAIPVPEEVKEFILRETEDLRKTRAKVKWVPAGSMHMTLKFLGEVSSETLEKVAMVCDELAESTAPFCLTIHGLGGFPNISKPGVIWTGFSDLDRSAAQLASQLDRELNRLGFLKEKRPFKPHLTIGRVKLRKPDIELTEAIRDGLDLQGPDMEVNRFTLYRSDLRPTGALYSTIREFPLKGRSD
jgi:2'-5' RNA ligase